VAITAALEEERDEDELELNNSAGNAVVDRSSREASAGKKSGKDRKKNKNKKAKGLKIKRNKVKKGKRNNGKQNKRNNVKKNNGKKGRKSMKNKNGQRNKKGQKTKRPRGGQGWGRQSSTCTISESCFTTALTYMKLMKDNVRNYERQVTRIAKQSKTGGSKSGKKGLFVSIVHRLVEAGGGNKSALACNNDATNEGSAQLKNLTDTLKNCEKSINESCNTAVFPPSNMTKQKECMAAITSFKTSVDSCFDTTNCSCWEDATLAENAAIIRTCKLSTEAIAVARQLKACRTQFGTCRKYQDDALTVVSACSKSPNDLLVKAKQIKNNIDYVKKAKNATEELISRYYGRKANKVSFQRKRATATTCEEVIEKNAILATLVDQDVSADAIITVAKEVYEASGITCSASELISLTAGLTLLESAVSQLETAYDTIIEEYVKQGGKAPTDDEITSATPAAPSSPSATAAAAGRRNRIVQQVMQQLKRD